MPVRADHFLIAVLPFSTLIVGPRALTWPGEAQPGHRKLFFLFLGNDAVANDDLWDAFFSDAVRQRDYEVLLHCSGDCRRSVEEYGDHFQPIVIPTVESRYCRNLVSPMVALLNRALQLPASINPKLDKFLFVSDSTLPAKPFWSVSSALDFGGSSRFCLMPDRAPALPDDDGWIIVKASQWSTLSRDHSQMMALRGADFPEVWDPTLKMGGDGCPDEYFPFFSIFGRFRPAEHKDCPMQSWEKARCPVAMSRNFEGLTMACDTYVQFGESVTRPPNISWTIKTQNPTIVQLRYDLATNLTHSATIVEFSPQSLELWRKSPFLFMRKVMNNPTFVAEGGETDFRSSFIQHVLQ